MNKKTSKRTRSAADTKRRIFETAIDLFSSKGYSAVGVRDVADAVGIKSASIYCHFESKDAILNYAYRHFQDLYRSARPELSAVMGLIPTLPPCEVLDKLLPAFSEDEYEVARKTLAVATSERHNSQLARQLIFEVTSITAERLGVVIDEMTRLNLVHPMDTKLFSSVFLNFGLSAFSCIEERSVMSYAEWQAGRKLLFQLVRTK